MIADAFTRLQMLFVQAIVEESNAASRRVLEKLGMIYQRRVQFHTSENGCFTGWRLTLTRAAHEFSEVEGPVVGVDTTEEMLSRSRARVWAIGLENVEFQVVIENLPLNHWRRT